ncbi:hypothetical protein DCAR_0207711 [Daucus carota subsp. sativus]|uniref:Uncharacterized protein n=1 Tax=Daucus carota subsp. sativus TaxID=79200 RepID=A0A161XGC1_DAUCS|nr:PREDICTED: uncharacterized protein LOC108207006 [Daucus carota subsp. sativus]WOG88476.1 hypothetical protein DCAR_0207711 [Daucus carota subsp. sativus]
MSTSPVKTKTLHNFSLPCLKWAHKNSTPRQRTRLPDSPHNPSSQPENDPNHPPAPTQAGPEALDGPEDCSAKPWNLRPRKCASAQTALREASEPAAVEKEKDGAQKSERRDKKTKLWITLSREEIEEDLYSMNGSKPARRPKKRTKAIQKQVDEVFPGLYLAGVTVDSYRVQHSL